jgi:hypothetical protein
MKNGFYFDDSLYDDLHGIHPRYGYRKNSILPCDDNIIDKFIDDEEVGSTRVENLILMIVCSISSLYITPRT